jgi:hypothetical protein
MFDFEQDKERTKMTTSIIVVAVTTALLGGTSIASAQVSSGSPEAAQQNFAKKPTDNAAQNDQQNTTVNRPQQNTTVNRPQETPRQAADPADNDQAFRGGARQHSTDR